MRGSSAGDFKRFERPEETQMGGGLNYVHLPNIPSNLAEKSSVQVNDEKPSTQEPPESRPSWMRDLSGLEALLGDEMLAQQQQDPLRIGGFYTNTADLEGNRYAHAELVRGRLKPWRRRFRAMFGGTL